MQRQGGLKAAAAIALVGLTLVGCAGVRRGGERVEAGLGDAVTAPLEDLNLKRDAIPAVLLKAQAAPYDVARMTSCEQIAAEVGRLDDALGPDLDEPPPPDSRTRTERGADMAGDAAVGAIRDTTTDLIPFRSWVRRLTGAEQHSRRVRDAIQAGRVRRGYLKGVGMNLNCAPPAAPSWFVPVKPEPPAKPTPVRKRRR
jgi:hypothetical protein